MRWRRLIGMATDATMTAPLTPLERYLDTDDAARFFGVSGAHLKKLRVTGGGPRFTRIGHAVRYRVADLQAWADARSATSTTQAEAA